MMCAISPWQNIDALSFQIAAELRANLILKTALFARARPFHHSSFGETTWVRGDPNGLPPALKVKPEKPEGKSKMWPKATVCKKDLEFHYNKDGHGDETDCRQQDSLCIHGGGHIQTCTPKDRISRLRMYHRCEHFGDIQIQHDDRCEGFTLCSALALIAMDVSAAMLAKAEAKGVYQSTTTTAATILQK